MCHFVLHAVSVQLNVYCEMLTMSRLFVALKSLSGAVMMDFALVSLWLFLYAGVHEDSL